MTRIHLLRSIRPSRSRMFLLAALTLGAVLSATERSAPATANADLRITLVSDPDVVGVSRLPASVIAALVESNHEPAAAEWRTDYAFALRQAASENKRVLLNFTGSDWCSWCKRLEADVFSKPEFQAYAAQNLILVKLDFPRKRQLPAAEVAQNNRLQQQFGVRGFPTLVAVDASGRKLGQITGYVSGGPKAFIRALEKQTGR